MEDLDALLVCYEPHTQHGHIHHMITKLGAVNATDNTPNY